MDYTLELEMNRPRYVPSGNVVSTGGLADCTGVIIHDSGVRAAYAGHFVDCKICGLEGMVRSALSKFNGPNNLDVYVVGGSVDPSDNCSLEFGLMNRNYVSELLQNYGFLSDNLCIKWSPPFCNTNLLFNVDTAENELDVVQEILDSNEDGSVVEVNSSMVIYHGDIRSAPNSLC